MGLYTEKQKSNGQESTLFAEQRQQRIVEQARQAGRVDVAELAAELAVTPETVRRDLTALERQGVLRRVHGGAIPVERLGFEPGFAARDAVRRAEKERIAKAALSELPVEGSVLLDAGTTTARLAEVMPVNRDLIVVTNSLPIALSLSVRPGLTVRLVGGRVRGRTQAVVDDWALRVLGDTYVDVAFVGTNGISVERGLTTPDPAEAAVKQAMLAAARRVVVLADHTKVGAAHFARFGGLREVAVLITDSGLDADVAARLEAAGPTVVRA
jgi:DeoR family transcriptional regulator, fructose operon transcriptional repressor